METWRIFGAYLILMFEYMSLGDTETIDFVAVGRCLDKRLSRMYNLADIQQIFLLWPATSLLITLGQQSKSHKLSRKTKISTLRIQGHPREFQ